MAIPIGTLGTIPTLTLGGRVFTDLTTIIVALAYTGGTNVRSGFRKLNSSASYQVTTGKTLTVACYSIMGSSAITVSPGYNDVSISLDDTTAYTNFVGMLGGDATVRDQLIAAASTKVDFPTFFQVPALKYPVMTTNAVRQNCTLFGYEA